MKKDSRFILRLLLWTVAFAGALWLLRQARFNNYGDELVYKTSIETWGSWANWARAYYHGNSGRVLIHALLIIFLNLPTIVWKLVSAALVAVTCCMIYRFATVGSPWKNRWAEIVTALSSVVYFFLMPGFVLASSVKWAPGGLNYLYPVCAMLICLFPFRKVLLGQRLGWKLKTAAALCVCLCGNMEQSSAVLSAMGLLCFAYFYFGKGKAFCEDHRKDLIFLVVIWAVNTAVALTGYFAPGNDSRYVEELLRFAGFSMYNTVEKFILGLQLFVLYFYSANGLLFLLFPSVIIFAVNLRRRNFAGMIAPALNIVFSCVQNILIRKVFDLQFVHPFDLSYLLWLGFTVGLLFFNGSILLKAARNRDEGFWLLFLYYGMIAAGVVVCLSPTLYVSASRTSYICHILLILILATVFGSVDFSGEKENNDRFWHRANWIFGTVVTVAAVVLFAFGTCTVKQMDAGAMTSGTELRIENVVVDEENRTVKASVGVEPFVYTAKNWCVSDIEGYDIHVSVGILDPQTNTVRIYRTYIHPMFPNMGKYPDEMVALTGYLREDCEPEEQLVVVYINHEGEVFCTPIPR